MSVGASTRLELQGTDGERVARAYNGGSGGGIPSVVQGRYPLKPKAF